jgi:uncharacterized damage-inducible protein DinB
MNKQAVLGQRGYFALVHDVTLRLARCFRDEDLDWRPKPGMRSVKELFQHMYGAAAIMANGVKAGKISQEEENYALPETAEAKSVAAGIRTVADLVAFCQAKYEESEQALQQITEAQLQAPVEAPYGTFPGWQFFTFAYDEHWHHRGQLYTYARLLDRNPPMLYDYPNPQ